MAAEDPREAGEFGAYWGLSVLHTVARTRARWICLGALAGPSSIYGTDGPRPAHEVLSQTLGLENHDRAAFEFVSQVLVSGPLQRATARYGPPEAWNTSG